MKLFLEPTEGFEPTTRCLQNSRSDQLSYIGIFVILTGFEPVTSSLSRKLSPAEL